MSRTPEDLGIHQQCWELLPWYATGSLNGAEQAALETHMSTCLVCRKELEYLQKLGQALHATDEADIALQEGLSATLARVEAAQQTYEGWRSWASKLGGWLKRFASAFANSPPTIKGAIALQFALVLAVSGLLLLPTSTETQPAYVTLSAPGLQSSSERARLSVTFDQETTEKAMRHLLMKLGARIVDGPTALGRYTVELPIPPTAVGPNSSVLEMLRVEPHVSYVEAIEPVSP